MKVWEVGGDGRPPNSTIVTGKYDPVVAPTLSRFVSYTTIGNNLRLQEHHSLPDMLYESIILITEWLTYGIVCLTGL